MSSSRVEAELGACVRRQAVLRDLGRQALRADDDGALLSEATAAVADALDVAYCGAFERRPGTGEAVLRAGVGWPDDRTGQATVPTDSDSLAGEALTSAGSGAERADPQDGGPAPVAASGSATGIAVGVGPPDEPWGVLGAYAGTDREFTDRDAVFLENVANVLAPAVESRSADASRDGSTGHIEGTDVEEVYERVSDAFFALDDECRFTYLNQQAEQLLGASAEELHGEVVWDAFPEAVGTDLETHFRDAIDTQEPVSFERRSEPLDLWADVRVYPSETGLSVYVQDVSERKERERKLELFRTLLDHSTEDVLVIDPETGDYLDVNETACRRLGYAREEFLQLSVPDLQTELPDQEAWDSFVEDLRAEGTITFDGRHRRKDGSTYPVEVNGSYVELDREYVIAVARDASERKAHGQELEQYRALTQAANDVILTIDERSTIQSVNPAVEGVFGYEPEELVGESLTTLMSDDLSKRHLAALSQYLETGERSLDWDYIEVPGRRADGSTVPLSITFSEVTYEGERYFTGVVRDVTEMEEREQELRRKERRYEAVLEDPNILVGLLDPDGTVLDINETAMEYVDADLADVTGQPFWDTPWWGDGDDVRADVREWVERAGAGEYVEFEADLTRPDGERYAVSGHFRPVTNDDGDVVSIIVSNRDVTERKRRERELEESERRYRTLVEHFPNGAVGLVDEDLHYRMVGGHPTKVANMTAEEIQGQPVREALPQPLADELAPRYEAALEGESRGFDVELDDRIYQVQIVPVRDDDGDIFAALGLSQDVTERERTQRKLATSERRYRTLVEHFPNGAVGLFDEDLRYTVAGGEILEEIGAPPEEIVGQTVQERYPQELVDQLEPNFQAALDGKTNSFEIEFHDRHWMAHTLPVRDGDGDIFAGMMMVQDVTDRKRRQRALRERERELQQHTAYTDDIFDAIDDLFYVVDESGTFRRWNRSLSEVTGYDDAEIESMYPLEFVVEEDRETIATGMAEVFESGGTRVEATVSTKDGERVPMEFVASALENPDGERVLAGIGRDITMRKERERQLQESNERLEQFAYAASHDLQEPLRMVSSYLRLIERRYADELDDDGREFIEFAVDGADRMREMIDALLQYSRVDTRGDPFEPVDLNAVFADVREDLRMKLDEHDAELTVEELPTVEGDGGQLRQLFQNLLDNAVDYSGDAPPRVQVSAERRGDEWRLAVSDEGIGIDPDDADRVFEVFQSLHPTDEHEGTGIGLALCERIVERHGGDIRVESEPAEGSTFSFTLPAVGDDDE